MTDPQIDVIVTLSHLRPVGARRLALLAGRAIRRRREKQGKNNNGRLRRNVRLETLLQPFRLLVQKRRGAKLSRPRHCRKRAQPVPETAYHTVAFAINTTVRGEIRTLVLSHRSRAR